MMKRICLALVLLIGMASAFPAYAGERAWEEGYLQAAEENVDAWGGGVQLLDIDMDGVPELLMGSTASFRFVELKSAYTWKDGQAQEISFDADHFPLGDEYRAFREDATGKYRFEFTYTLNSGNGYFGNYLAVLSWDGGYRYEIVAWENHQRLDVTYYFGEDAVSSQEAYDAAIEQWRSGWTPVEDYPCVVASYGSDSALSDIRAAFALYPESPAPAPTPAPAPAMP